MLTCMIQPPFGDIWDGLRAGKVHPVSRRRCIDRRTRARRRVDRYVRVPANRRGACPLPRRAQQFSVARIERDIDDLAKVSSYTADVSGRSAPAPAPARRARHRSRRGALHKFLAEITTPLLIVTTNYDTLLERCRSKPPGNPFDLVVYPKDSDEASATLILWWPQRRGESPPAAIPYALDLDHADRPDGDPGDLQDARHRGTTGRRGLGTTSSSPRTTTSTFSPGSGPRAPRSLQVVPEILPGTQLPSLGYSLKDWNLRVVLLKSGARIRGAEPNGRRKTGSKLTGRSSRRPQRSSSGSGSRARRECTTCAIDTFVELGAPSGGRPPAWLTRACLTSARSSGSDPFNEWRTAPTSSGARAEIDAHRQQPVRGAADRPLRRQRRGQELAVLHGRRGLRVSRPSPGRLSPTSPRGRATPTCRISRRSAGARSWPPTAAR